MAIPVVADADTAFGATTLGFLINLDYPGIIPLHWSPLILDEMSRALAATGRKPDLPTAQANEQLMRRSLLAANVPVASIQDQFKNVAFAMRSAKDTHVAACALFVLAQNYYPDN